MVEVDPQKLIGDVLRPGTIDSVDLTQATCRVRVGEILTGDIPWIVPRAGALRIWAPPTVGEQVLLICPEGDELAGLALPGLFSDAHPAPADEVFFTPNSATARSSATTRQLTTSTYCCLRAEAPTSTRPPALRSPVRLRSTAPSRSPETSPSPARSTPRLTSSAPARV